MEIIVKVRFNTSKQKIESFGNNRYLAYLPFPEDEEAILLIATALSQQLGVPPSRIQFKTRNYSKDYVFVI